MCSQVKREKCKDDKMRNRFGKNSLQIPYCFSLLSPNPTTLTLEPRKKKTMYQGEVSRSKFYSTIRSKISASEAKFNLLEKNYTFQNKITFWEG